jgi:hypothetical protein
MKDLFSFIKSFLSVVLLRAAGAPEEGLLGNDPQQDKFSKRGFFD